MALEDLPLELRERICHFVDDAYEPSVYSFALASQRCLEAATALLFRTIKISFSEVDQFHSLLERCKQTLKRRHAFKHVRRLEIVVLSGVKSGICNQFLGDDFDIEMALKGTMLPVLSVYSTTRTLEFVAALDALTSLVAQLNRLASMRYVCAAPLPLSLLQELNRRPHIGLQIDVVFPPYPGCCLTESRKSHSDQIVAHNASMMASPCLRQIGLIPIHDCESLQYGLRYFIHNFPLLAPGIDAISLLSTPQWTVGPHSGVPFTMDPDVTLDDPQFPSKRKIKHFRLIPHPFYDDDIDLTKWEHVLDYPCIETLHMSLANLELSLGSSSHTNPFTALQSLHLDQEFSSSRTNDTAVAFLKKLSPLRQMTLTGGWPEHGLREALQQHGSSLERFCLCLKAIDQTINESMLPIIELIRQNCPGLVGLSVNIQRTLGVLSEVSIYQALGSCAGLQDVDITLMVESGPMFPVDDEEDDEVEGENSEADDLPFLSQPWRGPGGSHGLKNLDVHDHLINCAVDASLAESIFRCISNAKPPGAKPLARLRLRIEGAGQMGQRDEIQGISLVTQQLARSWLVIPHPNIDRPGELLVTEVNPPEDVPQSAVNLPNAHRLPKALAPIFRRIWPEDPAVGDWRKEWHSLPLDV